MITLRTSAQDSVASEQAMLAEDLPFIVNDNMLFLIFVIAWSNASFEVVCVLTLSDTHHGHSLMMLVQEWQSSNGTVVPIQCVIDVVGNAFNSNDPAGLPVAQSQLMPLIQDSKKGPAIDLDAFLLVMLEEHLQGTPTLADYPAAKRVSCHALIVLHLAC